MNPILKRTIVALSTAAAVVCTILFLPKIVIVGALVAVIALVHLEFCQMVSKKYEIMSIISVVAGLLLTMALAFESMIVSIYIFTPCIFLFVGVMLLSLFIALFGKFKTPLIALSTSMISLVYIPLMLTGLLGAACTLQPLMFLYMVAIIKISDMGGFAFGLAFGKHKMCPSISPKKSWEGMAGSIFGSCLISCSFMPITHFSWGESLILGTVAAITGTLGDLFESRIKREIGVKDSATFMPAGMGGFLDMFDSLIFAPMIILPLISFFSQH